MAQATDSQLVVLNLKNQDKRSYTCKQIITSETSVQVKNWIQSQGDGLLIQVTHEVLNTQLDLSGVSPYVILQFDNLDQITGASLSIGTVSGSFNIISQARSFLVLPFETQRSIEDVLEFYLESDDSDEGYQEENGFIISDGDELLKYE